MKKLLSILVATLACKFAIAQTYENVLKVTIDSTGKKSLELSSGPGYLYKPQAEPIYYLYSKASRIRFDFGEFADDRNRKVILINEGDSKPQNGVFWLQKSISSNPIDCSESEQPFYQFKKSDIALFRKEGRPAVLTKDALTIDGQKLFIWERPLNGTINLTVGDSTVTKSCHLDVKKGQRLKIKGNKNGPGFVLKQILVNNEPVASQLLVSDFPGRTFHHDEFAYSNVLLFANEEIIINKETTPFKVTLEYDYLDDYFQSKHDEIVVDVDIAKHKGMPAGLWIPLVSVGGVILLLLLTLLMIRLARRIKITRSEDNLSPAQPLPGLLIDFYENGAKGKVSSKWYPEKNHLISASKVNLTSIERFVLVLSYAKDFNKAWRSSDDSIKIVKIYPRETILDILTKTGQKAYRNIAASIRSTYIPSGHYFDLIIKTEDKLIYTDHIEIKGNDNKQEITDDLNATSKDVPLQPSKSGDSNPLSTKHTLPENNTSSASDIIDNLKDQLSEKDKLLKIMEDDINKFDEAIKEREAEINKTNDIIKKNAISISTLQNEKEREERCRKMAEESLQQREQELRSERQEHDITKEQLSKVKAEAEMKIANAEEQCSSRIEEAILDCSKQISAEKQKCENEIQRTKNECALLLQNWKADKDSFLAGICDPVNRLYQISDDISRGLDESATTFSEYLDYIVGKLSEFSERVQNKSGEDGEWRTSTNAVAETAIRAELTDLIHNNSSWINAIARLYCYSRVREIGQSFEDNGLRVADIDSAYVDMVSLLGRYGITVIIPRILVDYYDDIQKKYFGFNNEDNAITRFVGRDVLVNKKDDLKIYDMGRIAYYLDGKITKGEIVHF